MDRPFFLRVLLSDAPWLAGVQFDAGKVSTRKINTSSLKTFKWRQATVGPRCVVFMGTSNANLEQVKLKTVQLQEYIACMPQDVFLVVHSKLLSARHVHLLVGADSLEIVITQLNRPTLNYARVEDVSSMKSLNSHRNFQGQLSEAQDIGLFQFQKHTTNYSTRKAMNRLMEKVFKLDTRVLGGHACWLVMMKENEKHKPRWYMALTSDFLKFRGIGWVYNDNVKKTQVEPRRALLTVDMNTLSPVVVLLDNSCNTLRELVVPIGVGTSEGVFIVRSKHLHRHADLRVPVTREIRTPQRLVMEKENASNDPGLHMTQMIPVLVTEKVTRGEYLEVAMQVRATFKRTKKHVYFYLAAPIVWKGNEAGVSMGKCTIDTNGCIVLPAPNFWYTCMLTVQVDELLTPRPDVKIEFSLRIIGAPSPVGVQIPNSGGNGRNLCSLLVMLLSIQSQQLHVNGSQGEDLISEYVGTKSNRNAGFIDLDLMGISLKVFLGVGDGRDSTFQQLGEESIPDGVGQTIATSVLARLRGSADRRSGEARAPKRQRNMHGLNLPVDALERVTNIVNKPRAAPVLDYSRYAVGLLGQPGHAKGFTPVSPVLDPVGGDRAPAYAPTSPAYAPTSPAYAAVSPDYASYQPESPGRAEHSPQFSRTAYDMQNRESEERKESDGGVDERKSAPAAFAEVDVIPEFTLPSRVPTSADPTASALDTMISLATGVGRSYPCFDNMPAAQLSQPFILAESDPTSIRRLLSTLLQ